jgi:hypothetical protein
MKHLILIILLTIPTFSLMLRPGIFTMHDFHVFRQHEFDLCAKELIFPCRWAPDSSLGYGQPLFNYYTQFPYLVGHAFRVIGLQVIDTTKALFILTLVISAISMYFLARHFWGPAGGLISAIFYAYAPYRAVDVWVRGALPESLAFVFFPLILYSLETKKYLWFTGSLVLLLLTHNLSLFMFLPFMGIWWMVRSRDLKFFSASLVSLLLGSFYLLPIIFESRLITLSQTTTDYYTFAHHFTTLRQLFWDRTWGFGGSIWGPNDTMSFSAGHLHWTIPLLLSLVLPLKLRGRIKEGVIFCILVALALLALFLTHGKSEIIWKIIPGLPYIQFPWRFLSLSTFFLSLAAGAASKIIPSRFVLSVLFVLCVVFYSPFFRPDIWRDITDKEQFSGSLWREQISSAISDFWPASSALPDSPAPDLPEIIFGSAEIISHKKQAHSRQYHLQVDSPYAKIVFPIPLFPNWTALVDGKTTNISASFPLNLITVRVPTGQHTLRLEFRDTYVRLVGNIISGLSLVTLLTYIWLRPSSSQSPS